MFKGLSFSRKPKTKVQFGLEVGSFSVKLTEVLHKPEGYELNNFAVAIIKGDRTRSKVIEAIKEVLSKSAIPIKRVNTSIFGQSVVVRYIQMPKMNNEELKSAIRFEGEKYIPFKINEVNLDAQVLGDTEKCGMRVLLVAAKKDVVDKRILLLQDAGLEVNLIDVDALCLSNIFLLKPEPEVASKACALLNIGAKATTVNICRRNQCCFTREINIGGDELTKSIANKMNLASEVAEDLKCRLPSDKIELLTQAMQPVLDNLINELRISFDYFESQFSEGISKIYICGGSSVLKGLDKIISQSLGITTLLWNPVSAFQVKNELANRDLSLAAPSLGVSLGLALRE
jgi:type IV pilus assembly protein PilM